MVSSSGNSHRLSGGIACDLRSNVSALSLAIADEIVMCVYGNGDYLLNRVKMERKHRPIRGDSALDNKALI